MVEVLFGQLSRLISCTYRFLLQSPHSSFAICLPAFCYDMWWILCVWAEQEDGKGRQCWHWGPTCKVNLPEMWRSTTCAVYYSSVMSGSYSLLWLGSVWWHFHKKVIDCEFHRCWPSLSRSYGCQGWALMGVGYGGVREWGKGKSNECCFWIPLYSFSDFMTWGQPKPLNCKRMKM